MPTPPVDAPLTTNVTNIKVHMTILHGFPVSSLFPVPLASRRTAGATGVAAPGFLLTRVKTAAFDMTVVMQAE